jgi:hypothetical protein
MTNEIIVVKQLPVIEEQLLAIKSEIERRVADALELECTEDTIKEIKTVRAALSKDFQELESKRKEVKSKILSPYERFEQIYKDCVTNIFRPADGQLAKKIAEVENGLKAQKKAEVLEYYKELCASKGIDFVPFDATGAVITLSASKKSLKERIKAYLDKVSDDLAMIYTQEYSAEILVEYKRSLNVSQSIMTVSNRMRAVEAEKQRVEQAIEAKEQQALVVQKVDEAVEEQLVISAPEEIQIPQTVPTAEIAENEPTYSVTFRIPRCSRSKLIGLREYMQKEGIDYESI